MDFDEDPDYLDLDEFLVQTKIVMCKLLLDIPGLEFLSPELDDARLQGRKFILPYWMAKVLYTYSMIDIELSEEYAENSRELIVAEPDVTDLHKKGPYFYQFGQLLLNLRRERGNNLAAYNEEGQRNKYRREEGETLANRREVATCLMHTFHFRRTKILDDSINNFLKDSDRVSEFEKKMDNMEKKLFWLGRQQLSEWNTWNSQNNDRVTSSQIASQISKKRKIQLNHETNKEATK